MGKRMALLLLLALLVGSCSNHVCTGRDKSRPLPFPHAMA